MLRKVIFWLAPNEILIPADQVPGAIADALYPRPVRNEEKRRPLNDPDAVRRLKKERKHASLLRARFPNLPDDASFPIGDLNDYLARLGMEAEVRNFSRRCSGKHDRLVRHRAESGNVVRAIHYQATRGSVAAMPALPARYSDEPTEGLKGEIEPSDFGRLLRVFDDIATDGRPRTLQEWLSIARDKGLKYHSWIDEYAKSKSVVTEASTLAGYNGPSADKNQIIDGFRLDGKRWPDILCRPDRDGRRFKAALVQKGRRGIQKGGGRAATLGNLIVFARSAGRA